MDVYDPIQQATCFVRSLGVTRSVSVSARATKAITFIYTFADLSWEMSYLLNFNVRIHLYSIPINFQKDCIDICFFFTPYFVVFHPFLWNCWAEQVLFTAPVASTTHFSFSSVHRRWTQPMTTLRALTEQDKRSVVPVRSDFWPKESNGLHKWAVVTKANISLCTVHCTVQCTVRCLHSSSWRSLRKTYDSVTFWGCPERQGWCVRFFWVGEEKDSEAMMCGEEEDWAGNQTYWRPEASPRQTSNYSEIGTKCECWQINPLKNFLFVREKSIDVEP